MLVIYGNYNKNKKNWITCTGAERKGLFAAVMIPDDYSLGS